MLRAIVSGVAIVWVVGALAMTIASPLHWPILLGALLLAVGCLYERRYHDRHAGLPDGRFVRTAERFVDPETGRAMTVWADPTTGERRYGDDGDMPA